MSISIEVDLGCIRDNLGQLKIDAKDKFVCPVLKADAYGHGAVEVAKCIEDISDYFAVATAYEGVTLRRSGIKIPILVLSCSDEDNRACIGNDLTVGVGSLEQAFNLDRSCSKGEKAKVHLQIDTGMQRLGFSDSSAIDEFLLSSFDRLDVLGVYTHIYSGLSRDKQIELFLPFEQKVKDKYACAISHTSSSSYSQDAYGDMIRPGLALYGYPRDRFKPAMNISSKVLEVKRIKGYTTCGYDGVYRCGKTGERIATVSGGYADGILRRYRGVTGVLFEGEILPIISVCMDSVSVLARDTAIRRGDTVYFIGKSENVEQYFDDVAKEVGTIPYEIMTNVSKRARRIYVDHKK